MTSSIFLLYCLCLFTFTSYFLTQNTSYSLYAMPARKLSISAPAHEHNYHKTQVPYEEMESIPDKEDSITVEYKGNSYSPNDLVYHTDYHGVTTHPTPKHPKP
ncbi:hypothetical protein Lal_00050014 [Lupinus albus]|uniref:Uncharacterized protein n=1 Tax=Lupinus albus TaxID=3870 RepID=A0A6A4PLQ6_LUPAL|nr:hypothetical protein Lalb_Chr12g0199731 [Lupinus albus]KAF1867584.1 hypothetical protein Lal_00050014 [Lupinus albus]